MSRPQHAVLPTRESILPAQAMLEAERERAVEAYRALKRRQSGAPLAEALARMEERGPM